MSLRQILDRLGTGERWWAAELVLRAAGLVLLAMAALAVSWLCRSVHAPPRHEATVAELLAALAGVVGGCGGGMLTFCGASLFERVPVRRGASTLTLWSDDTRREPPGAFPRDLDHPSGPKPELWLGGLSVLLLLIYLLRKIGAAQGF